MCSLSQFLLLLSSTNGSFSLQAFPTAGNTVGHFPWLHAETRGNGNARRINKWSADKERWTRKSKDRERKKERQREEERIRARKREARIERDSMREGGKVSTTCVAKKIARFYGRTRSCPRPGWAWGHSANAFRKQSATSKSQQTFMSWPKKTVEKTPRKTKKKITSKKKKQIKKVKKSIEAKNRCASCRVPEWMTGLSLRRHVWAGTIPLGLHLCHQM